MEIIIISLKIFLVCDERVNWFCGSLVRRVIVLSLAPQLAKLYYQPILSHKLCLKLTRYFLIKLNQMSICVQSA